MYAKILTSVTTSDATQVPPLTPDHFSPYVDPITGSTFIVEGAFGDMPWRTFRVKDRTIVNTWEKVFDRAVPTEFSWGLKSSSYVITLFVISWNTIEIIPDDLVDVKNTGPTITIPQETWHSVTIFEGDSETRNGSPDGDFPGDVFPSWSWASLTEVKRPYLFSIRDDFVDLNSLTQLQQQAVLDGAPLYSALDGSDTVTLPNLSVTLSFLYSSSNIFDAGAGPDKVTGGDRDDQINGNLGDDTLFGHSGNDRLDGGDGDQGRDILDGGSGDDVLIAGPGQDRLIGGEGNDTFDYQSHKFDGWSYGTVQILDGGTNDDNIKGINKGVDLLTLPGSPSDYRITVSFGTGWQDTTTGIAYGPLVGPPLYTLNTTEVERAVFERPTENVVSSVTTPSDILVEMARLCGDVYGPLKNLERTHESLAYEGGNYSDVGDLPRLRGWHPLSAIELGLKPADLSEHGGLRYSLQNGFYASYDGTDVSVIENPDKPEANALVLSGIVNNVRTLAVAFRGTDQFADFNDYPEFTDHFAKFAPLIEALKTYVSDSANGIQRIFVTGHSLGAGMAQLLLRDSSFAGNNVQAFTFGSPGADLSLGHLFDTRIVNFIHTDDLVPLFGETISTVVQVAAKAALTNALSGWIGPLAASTIMSQIDPKARAGTDIRFDIPEASGYGAVEHSMKTLYLETMERLVARANDSDSPFKDLAVLQAVRAASTNVSLNYELSVGSDSADNLVDGSERKLVLPTTLIGQNDQVVLAGGGDDTIRMTFSSIVGVPDVKWKVDGGTGARDILVISNLNNGNLIKTPFGAGTMLSYDPPILGTFEFAEVHRVEWLLLPDTTDGKYLELLTGASANVQRPPSSGGGASAEEPLTFTIDPSYDYADAGAGSMTVMGSAEGDIVLLGSGTKAVYAGGGADVIIATSGNISDILTLNGDSGDDLLIAGPGADILRGGDGDDTLNGKGGVDTAIFSGARSQYNVQTSLAAGSLRTLVLRESVDGDGADFLGGIEQAQFSDHVLPLRGGQQNNISNIDGDRFNDVLFQSDATGQVFYERMVDGQALSGAFLTNPIGTLRVAGSGHVDPAIGSAADVLVQDEVSGIGVFGIGPGGIYYYSPEDSQPWHVVAWSLEDGTDANARTTSWKLGGLADVNGDATVDAIIQSTNKGAIYYMRMVNGSPDTWGVASYDLRLADTPTSDYLRFAGAGDINADGFADVVVRNDNDGTVDWADMAGGVFTLPWHQVGAGPLGADYQVIGVGDVNGDGHADVIAQFQSERANSLNGKTVWGDATEADPANAWKQVTNDATLRTNDNHNALLARDVVDLNNDGYADVLFQNPASGDTKYWDMNPATGGHFTDIGTVPGWHVI